MRMLEEETLRDIIEDAVKYGVQLGQPYPLDPEYENKTKEQVIAEFLERAYPANIPK